MVGRRVDADLQENRFPRLAGFNGGRQPGEFAVLPSKSAGVAGGFKHRWSCSTRIYKMD